MSVSFTRTLRSLSADRAKPARFALAIFVLVFALWTAWLVLARVPVYRTSERARFEVEEAAHPVETPVSGLVVATTAVLGRRVQAGETLVELDAAPLRLELAEAEVRRDGAQAELRVLGNELAMEGSAARADGADVVAAVAVARARQKEAEATASMSAHDARVARTLAESGAVSTIDARRAEATSTTRAAAAEALRQDVTHTRLSRETTRRERLTRIARIERDLATAQATVATARVTIERLTHEIARRRITAPVDGELADVAWLPVGAHVALGQRVATVVPSGRVRIVAQFAPSTLGRVRRDQVARLRVDGFAWTQYGMVEARVTNVGSEPRDGTVRVELAPLPHRRIPIEHGLTATVEVEIERVTPLTLLFREVGQRYGGAVPEKAPRGLTGREEARGP